MSIEKAHPFGLTAADIIAFIDNKTGNKFAAYVQGGGLKTLSFSARDVQALIEPVIQGVSIEDAAKRLAERIQKSKIDFPFESFDAARFDAIIAKLLESGKNPDLYATGHPEDTVAFIGSCEEGDKRSRIIIEGAKHWEANHAYGDLWKPFVYTAGKIALINNPSGKNAPGRFIDGCTHERLKSSVPVYLPARASGKDGYPP